MPTRAAAFKTRPGDVGVRGAARATAGLDRRRTRRRDEDVGGAKEAPLGANNGMSRSRSGVLNFPLPLPTGLWGCREADVGSAGVNAVIMLIVAGRCSVVGEAIAVADLDDASVGGESGEALVQGGGAHAAA